MCGKIYSNTIRAREGAPGKRNSMEFINKVLAAEFDFGAISEFFKKLWDGGFAGKVEGLWDQVWGMLAVIHPFVAYILIALGAIELLFGKRLLGFQKFIAAFAVGFCASSVYLVPLVADLIPAIADFGWILAIVVGIIAILLRKVIYMVVYIAALAYIPYMVVYSGMIVESIGGNLIFAGAAAGVVVLLGLIFRKWFEMIGLSAFGAWAIVKVLDVKLGVIDTVHGLLPEALGLRGPVIGLIFVGVLTLIGFIFQAKTRKRY